MKRLVFSLIMTSLLSACTGTRSVAEPDPARAPNAVASAATLAPQPAPTPLPTPEAPPARATSAFSVVVEGRCDELDVAFLENEAFVHYGHLSGSWEQVASRLVFARALAEGGVQEEPQLTRGLGWSGELGSDGRPMYFEGLSGSWPEKATATMFSPGERSGTMAVSFTWKKDHWQPKGPGTYTDSEPVSAKWLNGSTVELSERYATYPELTVKPRGAAAKPDFSSLRVKRETSCGFDYSDMIARPSGELFLAGRFCGIFPDHEDDMMGTRGEAAVARWVPGERAKLVAIPKVANNAQLRLTGFHEASATSLYLFGAVLKDGNVEGADTYLAHFDGTAWTRVATPFKGFVSRHEIDQGGTMWVLADGGIYKRPANGEWEKQPLEEVSSVTWVEHAPVWAVAKKALHRRAESGTWTKVELPKPAYSTSGAAFAIDSVRMSPKGETWLNASYAEKRPQWTEAEERHALLRLGSAAKSSRCEAGGAGDRSFTSSWPAAATSACTTPFALLVRVSKAAPANYDYPQTRAALKGHTELEGAEFVDIELDGRKYFGATPKTIEMGQKMVEVIGKKVSGTHPELVCLAPQVTRTLPLDLATGAMRPTPR